MSFMRTLAALAVGFAAAKGYEKFRSSGGMEGMKDALRNADQPGGVADQAAELSARMGLPVGAEKVREIVGRMGDSAADLAEKGEAGMGSLLGAMKGMAAAGTASLEGLVGAATGGSPAAAQAMEENAKLMIRAMIQAAKADGTVDDAEKEKILGHLTDASEAELAFVRAELDAPIDVEALARATGETMKAQVYGAALGAVSVDNPAEADYLRQLSQALGLDRAARDAVHAAMGRPPLA
ncbi:MAG: tellurite resistance TerB family protein [Rhodobacteraceae bacterium]|nr:tellurite resistance TerB family protein [Paracoccaceae bacterium]